MSCCLSKQSSLTGRAILPIGTVRIHNGVRRVKVRMTGPIGKRWMDYARWWWEGNRGPVPTGFRVLHQDGDSMNDEPSNLILGTSTDAIFLWSERKPKAHARAMEKCHAACGEWNSLVAKIRREREWLPSLWYPVSFEKRQIINQPERRPWAVYVAAGMSLEQATAKEFRGIVLGWPDRSATAACILSVLVDVTGWLARDQLIERVNQFRRERGWNRAGDLAERSFSQFISELFLRGDIAIWHKGKQHNRYAICPTTLAGRGAICPVIAVNGERLTDDEFYRGFERVGDAEHVARRLYSD